MSCKCKEAELCHVRLFNLSAEEKEQINWVFLMLGQTLGLCIAPFFKANCGNSESNTGNCESKSAPSPSRSCLDFCPRPFSLSLQPLLSQPSTSAPPSPIPPLLPPPPPGHLLPRPLRLQRRLRCPPRRPRSGAAVPFVLVSSKTVDALPTRCQPGLAPELRDLFPQEVVQVLDTAGLNKLMNFKLDGLGSRVLLFELMDCAVVDRINNTIEFRIREGDSLWVTKDILQHVLDLPTGSTKELLAPEDTEPADQEYNNMTKALKYVIDTYKPKEREGKKQHSEESAKKAAHLRELFGVKNIELLFTHCEKADVKPYVTPEMLARLYLAVIYERFLVPGNSAYITTPTLRKVHDLNKLGDVDWAHLVHEELMNGCEKKPSKKYFLGCVAVPLIVFVDCCKGNQLDAEKSGRINLYDEKMLIALVSQRGKKQNQYSKTAKPLCSFEFEKWEESPYKQFELHQDDLVTLYKKRVLDRTRDEIVVDIGPYCIPESTFVDCLKKKGKMHSDILHLVCDSFLADNVDKAVLSYGAVQYLLNKSTSGGQELESDRVKDASEIYAPIVVDGHISLVVVSHTESKIYFLDSYPDEHKEVADILVTNLQSCLQRHDIDISLYEKVTPEVKAQQNNCDCGFHVLLYVRGFDEKEIYNIDKEKVKLLRMELTKFLLHHPENRKNPKRRRISVHEDIPDEEEECELLGKSEEATLNSNSSGSSLGESFGFGASEGTGQEDSHENSSAESLPGHNSPNVVKNKGVPKGKKGAGTSKAASKDSSEGSVIEDKPVKPVTKGKGKASKRKVASEDSTGKSPVFCQGKRRLPFSGPMVSFKPHTSLSAASCLDIYDIIKAKTGNDAPVFSVGQTSIKAGELLKFLEADNYDLRILNAFIHCLKCDDKGQGYSEQRIIIPAQDLNDDKFADVIKKELQELKNGAFRFLFFPTVHNEECIVFFVDVKVQDQVTIIQSSNSELTEHTADPIGLAFAKHVKQAFGPNSPISKLDDTLRVTQISYHVERKYSNLGSILALEHYSGKHCPRFQNNIEVNIASKLAHLIIHNENSAEKFPEVTAIVDNDLVNIRKQRRKAKNRTKKTNAK
ncbi:hypothetical protein D1007_56746 [Hordeum vulgare]|nr:hypothetical protein D1007_56746 [Hordeum vulgare]